MLYYGLAVRKNSCLMFLFSFLYFPIVFVCLVFGVFFVLVFFLFKKSIVVENNERNIKSRSPCFFKMKDISRVQSGKEDAKKDVFAIIY